MKKSLLLGELKNMKMIAHRLGYEMTKYPENSIEALEEIFTNQKLLDTCDGFEVDICFTKDLIPVIIHDKYIDDICDKTGLLKEYTLDEIREFKFKFRKSLNTTNDFTFNIITLEELLDFFNQNKKLLNKKIIRIESKDYLFKDNGSFENLANILNKYPKLYENMIHISFCPFNLKLLKQIQVKKKYFVLKNDLLCDYSFLITISKYMKYIDYVSLRIKNNTLPKANKSYSKRMNKKIKSDLLFMKFSNTIRENIIMKCINRYGIVNLYTLNDESEINTMCKYISDDFFYKYKDKIIITTNQPNKYK